MRPTGASAAMRMINIDWYARRSRPRCTDESGYRGGAVAQLALQKAGLARPSDSGRADLCRQDVCGIVAAHFTSHSGLASTIHDGRFSRFSSVSQPDSGLVLAKSFYRILGTIAGVLVTIALVFGLAQYGELFVAACWPCGSVFATLPPARCAISHPYGFQLAGYTVAIVGIPAALDPSGAYPLLLARFTEISLGIICAALVSRLILVRELSPKLIELVRALDSTRR